MTELKIGSRYLVTGHDCCVRVKFTAVLREISRDGTLMKFDNGVHLENAGGVTLEEVR
jgi:hypothetical protein